jgi:hypothetical protein
MMKLAALQQQEQEEEFQGLLEDGDGDDGNNED